MDKLERNTQKGSLEEGIAKVELLKSQLAQAEAEVQRLKATMKGKYIHLFVALNSEIELQKRSQFQFSHIYYVTAVTEKGSLEAMRIVIENFGEENAELQSVMRWSLRLGEVEKMVVLEDKDVIHTIRALKESPEVQLLFMLRSAGWL